MIRSVKDRIALGANPQANGAWDFLVWAPRREKIALHLIGANDRLIPMTADFSGYHRVTEKNVQPHARYLYQFADSQEYPDPASRFQPDGVHKPSEIVDLTAFRWSDAEWTPPSLEESVFYELHVGTFSEAGSFDGVAERLAELKGVGITTIELMPLAQFPGSRNWGYDGVYPFAVQGSYGGPLALQRLVDAAHKQGLAVALDVVYNHIGPEGNYLSQFGPYFTEKYRTPWGQAINFDDSQSDPVRRFFIENALYWFERFHVDVLRLDAVHGIFDFSAYHILAELEKEVELLSTTLGRPCRLIAESDLNDARLLLPREKGGYELPAQWSDDFHHSLRTLLTSETSGYYADFGSIAQLAQVFREGWYFDGKYSRYRRRRHGNSPRGLSRSHFVVFSQNHDQIGNRALGDRLSTSIDFEAQKLAAGVTLLSPFVPLLFMGEEYAETSPFQYFVSHGDKDLIEAVRRGRQEEFASFGWKTDVPDPQAESTFVNSKLHQQLRTKEPHRTLQLFYRELIRLRHAYQLGTPADWQIAEEESLKIMTAVRNTPDSRLLLIFNFSAVGVTLPSSVSAGSWNTVLNSADPRWRGSGTQFPQKLESGDKVALRAESFVILSQGTLEHHSRAAGIQAAKEN